MPFLEAFQYAVDLSATSDAFVTNILLQAFEQCRTNLSTRAQPAFLGTNYGTATSIGVCPALPCLHTSSQLCRLMHARALQPASLMLAPLISTDCADVATKAPSIVTGASSSTADSGTGAVAAGPNAISASAAGYIPVHVTSAQLASEGTKASDYEQDQLPVYPGGGVLLEPAARVRQSQPTAELPGTAG